MAYDQDLEHRIDTVKTSIPGLVKKKMFGGVGYLVNGNMCFGIHKNFLVVRTSVEKAQQLLKNDSVSVFDITGRPMKGWVMVAPTGLKSDSELLNKLETGLEFALSLRSK